jgi:glycosyltransferase involved in cell wall biosynthesis
MTEAAQRVKRVKKFLGNFTFFRTFIGEAAAIHALCPREADEIRSQFDAKRVFTVPNGVDASLLEVPEEQSAADLGQFREACDLMLGFVGRIDVHHKGIDLLLQAMAVLKSQSMGVRCKLFLVGPFHRIKDGQRFWSMVDSLDLGEDVKVIGPKFGQEKWRYFLACDVFVHTSRWEGMPMAVLEAIALGRPCLVTEGTNVADVVEETNGWVCAAEPGSIADAIQSVYGRRDSREVLARQSRELIRSRFTWGRIAQQLTEEYKKIIEQQAS